MLLRYSRDGGGVFEGGTVTAEPQHRTRREEDRWGKVKRKVTPYRSTRWQTPAGSPRMFRGVIFMMGLSGVYIQSQGAWVCVTSGKS